MPNDSKNLNHFVQRAGELYSLPAVAMQVLELTNHPKVDAPALKACIELDPALTIKILKVVNSSLFGLSSEVSDLNQAVAMLGTKPLKLLVLGFSLPEKLFTEIATDILGAYWKHTLTRAIAARELSEIVWKQQGDEAFICGLLGDLGMLVLLKEIGEPYVHFVKKVFREEANLQALEEKTLGFTHTELTAELLASWQLPRSICQAIAAPQNTLRIQQIKESHGTLAQVLHLSEMLACLVAEHRIDVFPELLEAGHAYQRITCDQIKAIVETLEEKVQQLADVLSLSLPQGTDYRDIIAEAHQQLSVVAGDAAGDLIDRHTEGEAVDQQLLGEITSLHNAIQEIIHTIPCPTAENDGNARSPHPSSDRQTQSAGRQQPADSGSTHPDAGAAPSEPADTASRSASQQMRGAAATQIIASLKSLKQSHTASNDNILGITDPALLERLNAAVAGCRQRRVELSFLLIQIDQFHKLHASTNAQTRGSLCNRLEQLCQSLDHPQAIQLQISESSIALILSDCDRAQAAAIASNLVRQFQTETVMEVTTSTAPPTVSVGVATVALPPKNFVSASLIESAERCLYGAQSSGGNMVKSIEIY